MLLGIIEQLGVDVTMMLIAGVAI